MKPLTIQDLQESSEDFKRHYNSRKVKYMAETEANEEEFLTQEFELWDLCMHFLNLAKYEDNDWSYLDDENVNVLFEGIKSIGYDKVYFSVKRKIEFIQEHLSKLKNPSDLKTEQIPVFNRTLPDSHVEIPFESTKDSKTKSVNGSESFDIIHVAIACWCTEIELISKEGKRLVEKHTNSIPGDSLYKEKYQITESYFKIVRNKRVDNAKRRAIAEAKRLIKKLNNKAALATITDMQSAFDKEYNQHYK